jgi:hypothetical protein
MFVEAAFPSVVGLQRVEDKLNSRPRKDAEILEAFANRCGRTPLRPQGRGRSGALASIAAALAATKPHRISVYRVADRDDLEERAKHLGGLFSP